MRNIFGILKDRTLQHPDKTAFLFPKEEMDITYLELYEHSILLASELQKVYQPKDLVLIAMPHTLNYVLALYACWAAGLVPIPVDLPIRKSSKKRFLSVLKSCPPQLILTNEKCIPFIEDLNTNVTTRIFQEIPRGTLTNYKESNIGDDDLALIQFTSGSTSNPKGVCISHKNLLHNSECIRKAYCIKDHQTSINWLPFFHDMGLVGNVVQTIYSGLKSINIAPQEFLRRPLIWLELVNEYKANTIGGPAFAFDLCVEKITKEQVQNFDLSSLKFIYCGAEVIRPSTLMNFYEKFKNQGIRLHNFFPSYGLAESTLIVSGRKENRANELKVIQVDANALKKGKIQYSNHSKHQLLGNGSIVEGNQIEIRNIDTLELCEANAIGEIWIKGDSVTKGYYQKSEENNSRFTKDGFFRTGDLGVVQDGELFVTGRLKEMIILNGQNYFPTDLESTISMGNEAFQKNGTVAFSNTKNGKEELVIIQEIKREYCRNLQSIEIFESIRHTLSEAFELVPNTIILLSPLRLPRTTSGKIQRLVAKKMLELNELNYLDIWKKKETSSIYKELDRSQLQKKELEKFILESLVDKVNCSISEIELTKPLGNYGLDSMTAMELVGDLEDQFDLALDPTLIWQFPTIREVVDYCTKQILLENSILS